MSKILRAATMRWLDSAKEQRREEENQHYRYQMLKRQEEYHKSLADKARAEWTNAQLYSDEPLGTWYTPKLVSTRLGLMVDLIPEAVGKYEWFRRFSIATKNGTLKYRCMLDGWNTEWGPIHEELAKHEHFVEIHNKARFHSTPGKEYDRLNAIPYNLKDYDPLPNLLFEYETPLDEQEELNKKARKREFKEKLEIPFYGGGCVVVVLLFKGLMNGSYKIGGFVFLSAIFIALVAYIHDWFSK